MRFACPHTSPVRLLYCLVIAGYNAPGGVNWAAVAQQLPGRTANAAEGRYHGTLKPAGQATRKQWTKEEDDILITGHASGDNWAAVAERLPGRSAAAARDRYSRQLKPPLQTGAGLFVAKEAGVGV